MTAEYWQRQCGEFFTPPGTYGAAEGETPASVNAYTGGWDTAGNTTRLMWTNGQFDPWRDSTVSSDFRPDGPYEGTPDDPVQVIPGAFHCSDLLASNGAVNAGVKKAMDNAITQIKTWVDEYYTDKEKKKQRSVRRRW